MSSRRKATALFVLVAATGMIGSVSLRAEPKQPKRISTHAFMRAKLASSQRVMEGLVTKDFDLMSEAAEEMKEMSEHAEWPRARDEVYEHYSEEFRRQCGQLGSLADKRNHEGAHFTFLSLTTTCVNCHDYVRGSFRVARDDSNPTHPVQLIPAEWDESSQGRIPQSETIQR